MILEASGGYVLLHNSSIVLAGGSSALPKTFADDEGDDSSRVGAASDPLKEGLDQLDTIIGFKERGTGIARERVNRNTRQRVPKILVPSGTFSPHSATFRAGVTYFRCPKRSATSPNSSTSGRTRERLLRGKPLDAVIAACIFIACRQAHVPRTFHEICNLIHLSKKVLGQCYKVLEPAFNLTPGSSAARAGATRVAGPEDLLVR